MSNHIDAEFSESPLAVVEESSNQTALAMPVVSPEQARDAMKSYLELCEAVLTEDDYQTFMQWDPKTKRKIPKRFKKKSAVKKLKAFFGVSVKIIETATDQLPDNNYGIRVKAQAIRADGKTSDECLGACSTLEERFQPDRYDDESDAKYQARCKKALARAYHDILATAETRASNRAVMSVIGLGGGEVTAEEMPREQRVPDPKPNPDNDHTYQLRYAMTAYRAFNPEAKGNAEIGAAIIDVITEEFRLSSRPINSSALLPPQLKWAGDHFAKLSKNAG